MKTLSSHDSRLRHQGPGATFTTGFSPELHAARGTGFDCAAPSRSRSQCQPQSKSQSQPDSAMQREQLIDAVLAAAYVASCALIGLAGATWIY